MSFAEWAVAMAHQHVHRFCLSSTFAQSAQLAVMDKLRHAQRDLEWADQLFGGATDGHDPCRETWTEDPAIQPLREFVEHLLVVEDWLEVVVAADLVLGNLLSRYLREVLHHGSREHRDLVTACFARAWWVDDARLLDWSASAARLTLDADPGNAEILTGWIGQWMPRARAVLDSLVAGAPLGDAASAAAEVATQEALGLLGELSPSFLGTPAFAGHDTKGSS
jgi:phenol hydroxylase P1 protein